MNRENRVIGSLMGLAIGDALGTTIEFSPPGTFTPVTDITGGGPFNLPVGYWTDDTSMALCTANSLIEYNNFNIFDQATKYLRWMEEGYMSSTGVLFDIGNTTRDALCKFRETRYPYSGLTDERRAGNGSIMRIAPVALVCPRFKLAKHYCGQNSKITHAMPSAVDSCEYMGMLISTIVEYGNRLVTKEELYSCPHIVDFKSGHTGLSKVIEGSYKVKNPPDIKGSGYVVESLEAALWAFYTSDTFEDGMLKAVNLGDDADTTGAVYGQIAGAFYGYDAIPQRWLDKLFRRDDIYEIGKKLCNIQFYEYGTR